MSDEQLLDEAQTKVAIRDVRTNMRWYNRGDYFEGPYISASDALRLFNHVAAPAAGRAAPRWSDSHP